MYRPSRFNVYKQLENKHIVYTYTGQCEVISNEVYEGLNESYCSDSIVNLHPSLLECGFIVSDTIDEFKKINLLRNKYILNPEMLSLYILPTEQCNFRCKYCYETFPDLKMPKSIQDGIIRYVARNISKYKVLHVEWFGGGPLLALDVIEYISNVLLEICKKNGVVYYAAMTTNAYLLDLECFRRLKRCRVLSYQITADGVKQTHDNQRALASGAGTYDRIMRNLTQIQQNIKTLCLDITIRVNISKAVYSQFLNLQTNLTIAERG